MRPQSGSPIGLSGCSGDEGCDDVGGVSVEGDAGAVVAHGGAGVGVARCFLHVAQGDASGRADLGESTFWNRGRSHRVIARLVTRS